MNHNRFYREAAGHLAIATRAGVTPRGDTQALRLIDVRFSRPLVLPRRVSLFVRGDEIFVADKPGRAPYLMGTFATR